MDRGGTAHPLSWLLALVAGALMVSALSLPRQPYLGLMMREDRVAAVVPGGPGDRAGLSPGDRIPSPSPGTPGWRWGQSPLEAASPGTPLSVAVERGDQARDVWLVPDPLPESERRMMAALLLVASGFVLLGGWVWSERRDRLTRPFYLLSLAFACILAPLPRVPWPPLGALVELLYAGLTLLLPALLIHFFALFPEPAAPRGRLAAGVVAGYGVAGLLSAGSLVALALRALAYPALAPVLELLQGASALWFGVGLIAALGLFARSYARASTRDARRRLRVALAGAVLGLAPLAALIVAHMLAPRLVVPGERWAVVLTLLVPASFAWAVAVHGIFDFAVALRASVAALVLTLVAGVAWVTGEWLAATWWPEQGAGLSGVALALVALAAALAGPSRPWARSLGSRLLAVEDPPALSAALAPVNGGRREAGAATVLARACDALATALKLDGCAALRMTDLGLRPAFAGGIAVPALEPGSALSDALAGRSGPLATDHHAIPAGERAALEAAGVHWVLPVGDGAPAAVLLLGRRLAGPWLGAREAEALERMAGHLAVELENLELRDAARSLGARDRELERAGAIQSHLLPRRAPVFPTLDCAAATLSSGAVGGDYYDFVQRSPREFTLVVGDAAGHGVPAALVLAGVQARFRAEAGGGRDPGEILRALNQELVGLGQPAKFVGLLCAQVDVRRGRVRLANGGLTPPLLRRRTGQVEELTAGGILLGVSDGAHYPDVSIDLGAGDVVVLYTDGLTEARAGSEMFGPERVREILDRHAHERASRILAALVGGVRAFADRPEDDLTVLVLKQLADPPETARRGGENGLKSSFRPAETHR